MTIQIQLSTIKVNKSTHHVNPTNYCSFNTKNGKLQQNIQSSFSDMTVYKLNFETSVFNMSAATGYWSTSLVATWQCIATEREREREHLVSADQVAGLWHVSRQRLLLCTSQLSLQLIQVRYQLVQITHQLLVSRRLPLWNEHHQTSSRNVLWQVCPSVSVYPHTYLRISGITRPNFAKISRACLKHGHASDLF